MYIISNIYPIIQSYTTPYIIRLHNQFQLVTSHHHVFSLKKLSTRTDDCNKKEIYLFIYEVRHRNIIKVSVKSRRNTLFTKIYCIGINM